VAIKPQINQRRNMLALTKRERYELWRFIKQSCDDGSIPKDINPTLIGEACLKLEPLNKNDYPKENND